RLARLTASQVDYRTGDRNAVRIRDASAHAAVTGGGRERRIERPGREPRDAALFHPVVRAGIAVGGLGAWRPACAIELPQIQSGSFNISIQLGNQIVQTQGGREGAASRWRDGVGPCHRIWKTGSTISRPWNVLV